MNDLPTPNPFEPTPSPLPPAAEEMVERPRRQRRSAAPVEPAPVERPRRGRKPEPPKKRGRPAGKPAARRGRPPKQHKIVAGLQEAVTHAKGQALQLDLAKAFLQIVTSVQADEIALLSQIVEALSKRPSESALRIVVALAQVFG